MIRKQKLALLRDTISVLSYTASNRRFFGGRGRSQHAPGFKEVKSGLMMGQQGEEVTRTQEHSLVSPQHQASVPKGPMCICLREPLCHRTKRNCLEKKRKEKVWSFSSQFLRHCSSDIYLFLKEQKSSSKNTKFLFDDIALES